MTREPEPGDIWPDKLLAAWAIHKTGYRPGRRVALREAAIIKNHRIISHDIYKKTDFKRNRCYQLPRNPEWD